MGRRMMTILSSLFSYGLYQFILCGPVFVTLVSDYLSMPSEACLWCIWFLVIFVSTPFMRSASSSQYIPKRKRPKIPLYAYAGLQYGIGISKPCYKRWNSLWPDHQNGANLAMGNHGLMWAKNGRSLIKCARP